MNTDSLKTPESEKNFRACMGSLAGAVCVVTGNNKKEAIGITVSSFTSLSLHPPLILFCLDLKSRHRAAFTSRKKFVVNILSDAQKNLAQHFASAGDKAWADISFQENKHHIRMLEHSIAHLSCSVTKVHKSGDHLIIIGKVEETSAVNHDALPLLYFRRHYHHLGTITE